MMEVIYRVEGNFDDPDGEDWQSVCETEFTTAIEAIKEADRIRACPTRVVMTCIIYEGYPYRGKTRESLGRKG